MRWLPACLAALGLGCAGALPAARPGTSTASASGSTAGSAEQAGPPWIEVDTPSEGERVRSPLPLIELRGRIGRGQRGVYDLVIALDRSESSLRPSGLDLDGDGLVAALPEVPDRDGYLIRRPFERWTSDFDDVVVWGELEAARRLLDGLHPTRARVAVVAFSDDAATLAPLGSIEAARRAIDAFEPRLETGGTSFAGAIEHGVDLLVRAAGERQAERAVVLITSDGLPTASMYRAQYSPSGPQTRREKRRALREARASADRARAADVAVYAFEVKNEADDDPGVLAEISEAASGRYVYVHDPSALRFELPNRSFSELRSVTVENRTLNEAGRAVRIFANGEFDAFVSLAVGENLLHVRGALPDGTELEIERTVFFDKPTRAYPSDTRRLQVMLEELQRRTEETRAIPQGPADPARARDLRVEPE